MVSKQSLILFKYTLFGPLGNMGNPVLDNFLTTISVIFRPSISLGAHTCLALMYYRNYCKTIINICLRIYKINSLMFSGLVTSARILNN